MRKPTAGNVRRTIYLSRAADDAVRELANRRQMGFSDIINEAILGGSTPSAPGECWQMPEAPIGSVFLPSRIPPPPVSLYG